jgi:hypothetical protein
MNGWWYIGDMMEGRRQADDMGGELLIITSYGVIQASKLIAGMPLTDAQASISFKINPRLAGLINRGVVQRGWQIVLSPIDQMILLLTPKELSQPYTQFCYNTQTRAWSQFVGVPINTASVFHRELYLGDLDNRIYVFAGAVDHVMLEDDGETAQPIEWESLTSFQGYNQPARFKRVQFLRPMFIGQATPLYTTQARYDFNLSQPPGSPPYTPPTSGAWDTSIWDIAFWGGSYIVDQPPIGGDGLGRYVAVYMRGRSGAETTHIGTDVMFDMGGIL